MLIGRKDINMRGLFKKLKKKRCNKCENVFKRSSKATGTDQAGV